MHKHWAVFVLGFFLAACSFGTQTTSGDAYLKSHGVASDAQAQASNDSADFKTALQRAASVEPTLRFPARIGVAKVHEGRLVTPSGDDMAVWLKMQQELGPSFGEVVAVNPMVAGMVSSSLKETEKNTMNEIRMGAARQHLDAVLVYEAYSTANRDGNLLSLVSALSIIGAYVLPTDQLDAEGYTSALLIDVMQGYPYGSVDASVEKAEMNTTLIGSLDNTAALKQGLEKRMTEKLSAEVKMMIQTLMTKLK